MSGTLVRIEASTHTPPVVPRRHPAISASCVLPRTPAAMITMSAFSFVPSSRTTPVTFALPEDKTIDEVVGSAVAEDHVTHVDEEGQEPFDVHWSPVEGGGFVSWVGNVYRFAPEAEGEEPPGYVMIYDPVDELELLDPAEVDALKQYYNITLNLA